MEPSSGPISRAPDGRVLLRVKAVPGAATSAVVGRLGDRLKVRLAAPASDGAANRALLDLLAERLGLSPRSLTLVHGAGQALKVVAIQGPSPESVARALGLT